MRCLILAHPDDETALRVAASLRRRLGKEAVRLVAPGALALAPAWRHHLAARPPGAAGLAAMPLEIASQVRLASGELLAEQVGVIFNRLQAIPVPQFESAGQPDRDYAALEMFALVLSWLAGLQRAGVKVINPASPRGLGAQGRSRFEWLLLAQRAGLPAADYRLECSLALPERPAPQAGLAAPDGRILAAGEGMLGEPQALAGLPGVQAGVRRLQHASACPLLELHFSETADGWRFVSANPMPILNKAPEIELISAMLLGAQALAQSDE